MRQSSVISFTGGRRDSAAAAVTPATGRRRPLRSDRVTTGRGTAASIAPTDLDRRAATGRPAKSARRPRSPSPRSSSDLSAGRQDRRRAGPSRDESVGWLADTIDRARRRRCNYEESLRAIVIGPRARRISTTTTATAKRRISGRRVRKCKLRGKAR